MPYPQQSQSARERTIKTEPDFVERVLNAVVSGNSFRRKNKARVKQILAKHLLLDYVDKAEEHYQSAVKVLSPKLYINAVGVASMIEFMAKSDPVVATLKPEKVISHTLLKKLDDVEYIEQINRRRVVG